MDIMGNGDILKTVHIDMSKYKRIWFSYSCNDIIGLPRHCIPRTRQLSKDTETVNQPPHSFQRGESALCRLD